MKFRNLAAVGLVLGVGSVLAGQDAKQAAPAARKDAEAKPAARSDLKDQKQKLSYILGLQQGKAMKQGGFDVDFDAVARGIKDGFQGTKPQLTDEEIGAVLNAYRREQAQKAAEVADRNLKEGQAFLAANAKKPGVKTTASGLQYKVLKEGTGKPPRATDTVRVNYKGTLIDGTEFDSSEKHGGPASFQVKGVVPGFSEALQLMKVGSKYQVFLPSELAYGAQGAGGAIGPNATLIFELELLGIE